MIEWTEKNFSYNIYLQIKSICIYNIGMSKNCDISWNAHVLPVLSHV